VKLVLRILIIYTTLRGRTGQMVAPIAEGIQEEGVEVLTRPVETVTWEEMLAAHGIIVGNPTRFGGVDWQIKRLFDVTALQDYPGPLVGKVGGAFSAGGRPGGGAELALMATIHVLLNHGMVIQGNAYGAHYGPVFSRDTSADTIQEECRSWGRLWAQLVKRLAYGTPAEEIKK
jgi:NAD(P)H dehydrogenase (quinone)